MKFAHWYFLLLIPPVIWLFYGRQTKSTLMYSSVAALKKMGLKKTYKHHIGGGLLTLGLCLLIIALARPQMAKGLLPRQGEGIDIAMVLDVSKSMESVDLTPNRLEVAKTTIEAFVEGRGEDRVGLVVFAGSAYTRVPLTLDHQVLNQSLALISSESVTEEGTAIGMALSVGMNRLKKSEAPSKVMILVTDGDNNAGAIDPNTAAELAADLGIRVYTIGVGTDETILPYSYFGQIRYQTVEGGLNEPLLEAIAQKTGGRYYRAKESSAFEAIFEEIDALEKTSYDQDAYQQYEELAFPLMKIGLLAMVMGLFFSRYRYIQIP